MTQSYPDLKDVERRKSRYWNVDGLPELIMGGLWVLWGVAFGLPKVLPAGEWQQWYWMFVPLLLMCSGFLSNWVTRRLKERFTYPRAGYAAFAPPSVPKKALAALLSCGIAGTVAALALRGGAPGTLAAPGVALFLALALLFPMVTMKLPHYAILSAASVALAIVFIVFQVEFDWGMLWLLLGMGAASMAVGGYRLRVFLRTPAPGAE
ncbi:MAG TPA: hypothetical protein DEH78_07600 [Solibacterales bacterium]|nr:hypothetical protein [Bryobacterales bacterium]